MKYDIILDEQRNLAEKPPENASNDAGRKHNYLRWTVATIVVLSILAATNSSQAVVVPAGTHPFDSNLPLNAFIGFNSTTSSFFTPDTLPSPPPLPAGTFGVSLDAGALHQDYPDATFQIISGFQVSSSFVFDAGGSVVSGDPIFASIDHGKFQISDSAGVIVTGEFDHATFSSAVNSTAGSLNTSNVNNLILTPGPAFTFDTSFVSSISNPTGFSISLSSIPLGVTATSLGGPGPFVAVNLNSFQMSTGSAVASGNINVVTVPEPATLTLFIVGLFVLVTPAYRRWRRIA